MIDRDAQSTGLQISGGETTPMYFYFFNIHSDLKKIKNKPNNARDEAVTWRNKIDKILKPPFPISSCFAMFRPRTIRFCNFVFYTVAGSAYLPIVQSSSTEQSLGERAPGMDRGAPRWARAPFYKSKFFNLPFLKRPSPQHPLDAGPTSWFSPVKAHVLHVERVQQRN